MNPVPDPESGPPALPVAGRRRAPVPVLSIGELVDVRPGSLLVAMPGLTDPTFAGAVVYVLDHSETGTLGVVLGSPSQVAIRDVLPGWCDLAVDPGVFHVGGPCESDTALCLAMSPGSPVESGSGLRRVAGDVYLVDLDSDPAGLPERGFAERLVAPFEYVYSTEGLAPDTAVFTEPTACAVHGLETLAPRPGSSALIFGAGPTGLLLAQLLAAELGPTELVRVVDRATSALVRMLKANKQLSEDAAGELETAVEQYLAELGLEQGGV